MGSPVMIYDTSACILPASEDMELEALIKHLLGELRHRETVILENIESLKETNQMIDKMKEVAIKQFQQQQDIINEKNREITQLIENKNKEVTTVIQERKRSLDEKSKEVSKITQEKDKEILKLSQSLAASKENLLQSRRMTEDFEIKRSDLEQKLENLQTTSNDKEDQINRLQEEIKLARDERERFVVKVKYEKESIMTEKSREMKAMSDEFKKEMTRVKENVSLSKLELSRFQDKVEKMQAQQESLENQLLQKEDVISNLHGALEESKRKTEFKSNLERSFESLQNQFQTKVDEIERLRKRLGIDDNKNRRPSKEKKLI